MSDVLATRLRRLRDHVRANAENRPGVYRMYGPGGALIYVGKSIRVRTRLLSYFRAPRGEKAAEIAGHAERVAWDYVPSEFAALLHELRTIRRYRPPYNVQHKRRPGLAFVQITAETAPRLRAVPPAAENGRAAFGPIAGRLRTGAAVRHLVDVLGLRDCPSRTPVRFADQLELFGHRDLPHCWRGETGRCVAPCAAACTEEAYEERVRAAADFLIGESDLPIDLLGERLAAAVAEENFEHAATLRDRITLLERLRDDVCAIRAELDALSVVYRVAGWNGEEMVYLLRGGSIEAELPAPRTARARRDVRRRVATIYENEATPLGRVPMGRLAEMLLVARWFRLRPEERSRALAPQEFAASLR